MCDYISDAVVKTRKAHRCWGCTNVIPVGVKVLRVVSKDCGEIHAGYWCDKCLKMQNTDPFFKDETCFEYGSFAN